MLHTTSKKANHKFRDYDTLKVDFENLHLNINSDSEIMKRLIVEYTETDDKIKPNILEDMDFLLHQIDNAVNFVAMGMSNFILLVDYYQNYFL